MLRRLLCGCNSDAKRQPVVLKWQLPLPALNTNCTAFSCVCVCARARASVRVCVPNKMLLYIWVKKSPCINFQLAIEEKWQGICVIFHVRSVYSMIVRDNPKRSVIVTFSYFIIIIRALTSHLFIHSINVFCDGLLNASRWLSNTLFFTTTRSQSQIYPV